MKSIVIFASGNGSNAQRIIEHFHAGDLASVDLVLSNKARAQVLERATRLGVAAVSFNKKAINNGHIKALLDKINPDLIVLAGYLWLFPEDILKAHNNKVINIHPALLPDYGGKGMYGMHVHDAVIAQGEKKSGITIHYVTPEYDKGSIIFQAETAIDATDTPETLAGKIHALEHEHFPKVLEKLLTAE
ncbi:MAG: phosphoribosylglycinamide formyltransferase [Cytophagaceae bacterium]|nr:phosphoribosylglycinamide formyltransferase [Cytophagaceae bacterium]|tara:strand:+ start:338 stop:904 length:567 start_codon:yes stop_codon:yes gene_type:complete